MINKQAQKQTKQTKKKSSEYSQKPKDRIIKSFKPAANGLVSQKDTDENPLLKVDLNQDFHLEIGNLLNDPNFFISENYVSFNKDDIASLKDENGNPVKPDDDMMIILRYFEYVIKAKFKVSYILPLLLEGQKTHDIEFSEIIEAIEHRLQLELQLKCPTFETINLIYAKYLYKIRYNNEN